jgi:hypothetical protein
MWMYLLEQQLPQNIYHSKLPSSLLQSRSYHLWVWLGSLPAHAFLGCLD